MDISEMLKLQIKHLHILLHWCIFNIISLHHHLTIPNQLFIYLFFCCSIKQFIRSNTHTIDLCVDADLLLIQQISCLPMPSSATQHFITLKQLNLMSFSSAPCQIALSLQG